MRVLAILPTYDERENLGLIVPRILAAVPEIEVLVVDDASPDGTGRLADELAAADSAISVLHRKGKEGLGVAYLAGFDWALERGYDVIVEIDADGSHPPERLPAILSELDPGVGLVIGSRWVPGGSVVNWPRRRLWLSRGGNLYVRKALGIHVQDATAGFRAYRAAAIEAAELAGIGAHGYLFQVEMTKAVLAAGFEVREVPIEFREREYGESKMSGNIVAEAMLQVTRWGVQRRLRRLRRRAR